MALFGKKSNEPQANSAAATASPTSDTGKKPGRGLSLGRKKDNAPAPAASAPMAPPANAPAGGAEDFSDFSGVMAGTAPAPETAVNGKGKRGRGAAKPEKKKLKSGTVVGLNIGNDSIKAIELRIKGDAITVSAMGMVPTPTESISNGVVMSVSALSQAIRELFKQTGISTKGIVSSVSGTGSLVVRVIEVPQMTDSELAENMKVDADRYIPFPPSEVIMDFRALRDLPTDPNSGNMEVLLAAAQREIIDLHINVLQASKMTPHAIDVEPLAVARTLLQSGEVGTADGFMDYNNVSAIMNLGATSSEISVLRGDILVFTRSVPIGGNAITQHIVDNLGLPWHDAERLKREWGDALPPYTAQQAGAAYGTGAAAGDDWNEFNNFDAGAGTTAGDDLTNGQMNAPGTPATSAPPTAAPTSQAASDPFDLDFFSQGPQNNDPKEQHGQKQDDEDEAKPVSSFDFSGFNFDEEPVSPAPTSAATPADTAPATPDNTIEATSATPPPGAPATTGDTPPAPASASGFNFAFPHEDEATSTAPAPVFSFDVSEEPAPTTAQASVTPATTELTTPSVPVEEPAAASPFAGFSFDAADDAPINTASAATPAPEPATEPSTTGVPAITDADMETVHATSPSAYDLSGFDVGAPHPGTTPADPALASSPAGTSAPGGATTGAAMADEFDIDSLFATGEQSPAQGTSTAGAATAGASATDINMDDFMTAGAAGTMAGAVAQPGAQATDFGMDFEQFGAGLGGADTSMSGIQPETVHTIIRPLLEELANETRRSLEYYASRYPDTVIRHVTLVGGGARLKNLDAFLTQMLGIPTTVGNPLARMTVRAPKLPPDYADQNSPLFAVAVGLALRDVV